MHITALLRGPRPAQALAWWLAVCLVLAVPAAATAATRAEVTAALSADGLQKVKVKGLDAAYARPGISLSGYQRVKIDPVEVAFDKNWDPQRTGSSFKLSADERESIRSGVATIVREEFVKALQAKDGYQVTDDIAADVLRIQARVVDLYVNAPDTMSAGRSQTYTMSSGRMTLLAELYDAESGQLLARLADTREGRSTGQLTLSNRVNNAWEASNAAAAWGRALRNALDKARQGLAK